MTMDAGNRRLPDWWKMIRTGQLRLPRFQRFESWSHREVSALLDAVLRGRPIGAALILQIGGREPFKSRAMAGAPEPTERPTEHLLDGQQRLTALWKALNDQYEDKTYFVMLRPDPDREDDDQEKVRTQSRWTRNNQRYPVWADQPKEQLKRGRAPMYLLNPERSSRDVRAWCDTATESIHESRDVQDVIEGLRTVVREINLPYLQLPAQTSSDEAIEVFIKMNTSSVDLRVFDIIVAQMEEATGQSLHQLEGSLRAAVPEAERYVDIPDLVLRVAALRDNRPPTESSFKQLDMRRLWDDWEAIERGVKGAIRFLSEEHIYDRDRLPTVAVVPILASIWSQMPQSLDAHGEARTLLRQYLWRSFFTDRYDRAAGTAALQDHRGLKARLVDGEDSTPLPVLDEERFPVAKTEQLEKAPWPKLRNTLARAILAASLRSGGRDFADDSPAAWDTLSSREYHHLFPEALLDSENAVAESNISLALNCALITWNTNRRISAKEPVAYLRERAERASLGENQIRSRLDSHIIPFDNLNVGGYSEIVDKEARGARIKSDYESFIRARAEAIHRVVTKLCNGEEWNS